MRHQSPGRCGTNTGHRARLRLKARAVNANDKDGLASLQEKRRKLSTNITGFRALQRRHMPFVAELLAGEDDSDGEGEDECEEESFAEDIPLMLPSWFSAAERQEHGMPEQLAEIERGLREAHAEGVLSDLRLSIRTFGVSADEEKEQFDSARDKPRARSALKKMKSKQRTYVAVYQEHYEALLGLGMSAEDRRYRPLDASMLSAHQPTNKPQALGRGKGQKEEAWFWRGEMDVGLVSAKEKKKLAELTDDGERVRSLATCTVTPPAQKTECGTSACTGTTNGGRRNSPYWARNLGAPSGTSLGCRRSGCCSRRQQTRVHRRVRGRPTTRACGYKPRRRRPPGSSNPSRS